MHTAGGNAEGIVCLHSHICALLPAHGLSSTSVHKHLFALQLAPMKEGQWRTLMTAVRSSFQIVYPGHVVVQYMNHVWIPLSPMTKSEYYHE